MFLQEVENIIDIVLFKYTRYQFWLDEWE
jgi:hypothetical protein